MQPRPCERDREHLYFCYLVDCQTPQKPGGGPDQTWEVAEQAVRGITEVFAERGLIHALGFCSEPEVARRQSALFQEMAELGAWQALHFQVRGYRPAGAAEDYDWERTLAEYGYDEQKAVLTIARDEWEQALGMSAEDFGACCAQANDFTFPILAELGFRQSYCSCPGRHNPAMGQAWWGAFPHSHHASSRSRLVCGDLDLYELTLTRTLTPREVGPGVWAVDDLRAERERDFDDAMAIAEASVRDMMLRDHPILYVHAPTHNTWDATDRSHPRRAAVETVIDVAYALAEKLDLALVPATMKDMHERADELGAYAEEFEAMKPLLLLTAPDERRPFDAYLDEVLHSEGWCLYEHRRAEAAMTAADLAPFALVIISHGAAATLSAEAVEQYLSAGGRAIVLKPPREWGPLFGLTPRTAETYATVRDAYIRVCGDHPWLPDLPEMHLQCPGEVEVYEPADAEPLAFVAGQRGQATEFPAVALGRQGAGAGVLFAFDLADCIVALHQGRIANASDGPDPDANRDGKFTADDLFEGTRDFDLRHVPQADVLQDLLGRVILGLIADVMPLPRLWHFPHAAPGLVLVDGNGDSMNRDDLHATVDVCERHDARFGFFLMDDQIADFDPAEVNAIRDRGHAFGPHPWVSFRPTVAEWGDGVARICRDFRARFGFDAESLRTHSCIFPGWDEAPRILADRGLRLDTSFLQGYRFQSGFLNGSALPARFVNREGRVLDCWEQSTVHGDDTLVTTKVMLPPKTEQECIDLSLRTMRELAERYHGVFHPYFHPINVGGRGRINTARWLDAVLAEGRRLGMPAPSCDAWLHFTEARRAAAIRDVAWDPATGELGFRIEGGLPISGLTVLLPRHAGGAPARALVDGAAAELAAVPHEGLGWTALEVDLAAGGALSVCALYASD